MVLGVQHIVFDARPLQKLGEDLRLFNGDGTHQHGLSLLITFLDLADDGPELARLGLIDHVVVVLTGHRPVGGDLHHVQRIGAVELLLLGHGGTRHAGELAVKPEIVLEGDGGQGLALPLDLHSLLGLDGLMQTLGIPPAKHEPPGKLIHDDDLVVLHHIINVPLHQASGPDGLIDVVRQGGVFRVGKVLQLECLLRLLHALGGEGHRLGLLVHHIVGVNVRVFLLLGVGLGKPLTFQPGGKVVHDLIQLGRLVPLTGDNKRGPGLVNEDGVHLVHNGEGVAPLDQLAGVNGHVVPQVVKAKLVVGAIGNVGSVGGLTVLRLHVVDNKPHGKAQEAVNFPHPLTLIFGQIVVDRDNVDPLAGEGVQIGGQNGHQSLTFTGLHLGDAALMENDAADQLDPEGPQPHHPVGCLPHGGEGLRENVIQCLAVFKPLFKLRGLGLKLRIGQGPIGLLQRLDFFHDGFQCPDFFFRGGTKQFFENSHIPVTFPVTVIFPSAWAP